MVNLYFQPVAGTAISLTGSNHRRLLVDGRFKTGPHHRSRHADKFRFLTLTAPALVAGIAQTYFCISPPSSWMGYHHGQLRCIKRSICASSWKATAHSWFRYFGKLPPRGVCSQTPSHITSRSGFATQAQTRLHRNAAMTPLPKFFLLRLRSTEIGLSPLLPGSVASGSGWHASQ